MAFSLAATPVRAAFDFEKLRLPASVSQKTEYYTVDLVDRSPEPGFLKFQITAPHARYEVEGIVPFLKLLREIQVIEQIRRDEKGSGFFDGAAASVEATKDGFVNLVQHPVVSVKGMGRAIGKLGRSVGGVFRKKEEGEKSSFGEKMLGGSERELAKEFDVDVYTDNPYLSGLLLEMARARAGGKGAVAVVKFFIPVAALVSVGLTASGLNGAADKLVNDSSRTDLFRDNKKALLGMGFSEKETLSLLNFKFYSPRDATYMRVYLEKLRAVPGQSKIPMRALQAPTLLRARKVLWETGLAAEAVKEGEKYDRIEIFPEGAALRQGGKVILFTSYDYVERETLYDRVMARADMLRKDWGAETVELRNGGMTAPGLSFKGIVMTDRLFFKTENE